MEDLPRCAPPRLLEDTFRILRGGVAEPGLPCCSRWTRCATCFRPSTATSRPTGPKGNAPWLPSPARPTRASRRERRWRTAVLLAVLLVPLMRATSESSRAPEAPEPPSAVPEAIESMLQELVRTARLPRRIAERCRMMLLAQATLSGQRRRRGNLASFRRHPLFNESLTVFACTVEATGEGEVELQAWQSGQAPAPRPGTEPAGSRRRRRRRRGGRGGPGGGPSGPGAPGGGAAGGSPPSPG